MKGSLSLILTIGLVLASVLLTFLLIRSVKDPIDYRSIKMERTEAIKDKLTSIKDAQIAYKSVKGSFAGDFESLKTFMKTDSVFTILEFTCAKEDQSCLDKHANYHSLSDNPNVPGEVIIRKKVKEPALIATLGKNFDIDNIGQIPFTDKDFAIDADTVTIGLFEVPVFEVAAKKDVYLADLGDRYKEYMKNEKDLIMGSMYEPKLTGNWK